MFTEVIIIVLLVQILCAASGAAGFYLGSKQRPQKEIKTLPEPNEQETKLLEKQKKDYWNLITYDGSEQE